VIGYYVHDHGEGHAVRATAIASQLSLPVTGLSSRDKPTGWRGEWIRLEPDHDYNSTGDGDPASASNPTANGALHWAPLGHRGLRRRMAQLASWIEAAQPRLMVVDVSVEVALLARLLALPVAVIAMPGRRDDDPHQLAYRIASAILAPWPEWAKPMTGAEPWAAKVHAVGSFSRFDQRTPTPTPGARRVLVLNGRGGPGVGHDDLAAARLATPDWHWDVLGSDGSWVPDPWQALTEADVVVTHAGQNAIAEVAAARRAAVVIPDSRPYGEQRATARVLDQANLASVRTTWPPARQWPEVLQAAQRRGGDDWARWNDGHGATRAAALLEAVADGAEGTPTCAAL
jgi:hypothetical protein